MAPLRYDERVLSRDAAFRRVRAYLAADTTATLDPESDGPDYLHAVLVDASGGNEADLEMKFLPDDPLVAFRLLARRPTTMQPICITRGCINGNNAERQRVERLRVDNGLVDDSDRYQVEKDWTPIFLH